MINFESENIEITKKIIKDMDLKNIKKDYPISECINGWQAFLLKNENFYSENLGSIGIFSLNPNSYIAHRHISEIDYEYCHYILNTNEHCGIIIGDEYLPYKNDLLFSFNYGTMPHIAWNNGETVRDTLVVVYKTPNISMQDWLAVKMSYANSNDYDFVNLEKEQIMNMTNRFNIKLKIIE